ncbi:MAG: HAD family hydrolase [Acidobacteriota bacterium]
MHIAFDADDTLWHNERVYNLTQDKVADMLAEWAPAEALGERLNEIERRNLRHFGYGLKGFTLSLIETAIEISDGRVPAQVIHQIVGAGKAMTEHPIELLPGVRETVSALGTEHRLMLITKGDLFDQESKIARSGVADLFEIIEVVSEKDPASYQRVLRAHDVDAARFVMVGNSVKSDILPVVAIGGNAIHVPYETEWALEKIEHRGAEAEGFFVASGGIREVPGVLGDIAAQGWVS